MERGEEEESGAGVSGIQMVLLERAGQCRPVGVGLFSTYKMGILAISVRQGTLVRVSGETGPIGCTERERGLL